MVSVTAKHLRRWANNSGDAFMQQFAPQGHNVVDRHNATQLTNTSLPPFFDHPRPTGCKENDGHHARTVNRQYRRADLYDAQATGSPRQIGHLEGDNNRFSGLGDPHPQPHHHGTNGCSAKNIMAMKLECGYEIAHIKADEDSPRWIARSDEGGLILLPVNPKNVRVYTCDMLLVNKLSGPISTHANAQRGQVAQQTANDVLLCSRPFVKPAKVWIEAPSAPPVFAVDTQGSARRSEESMDVHRPDAVQWTHATQDDASARNCGRDRDAHTIANMTNMSEENKKVLCDILVDGKLPSRSVQVPEEVKNLLPLAESGHLTSIGSKNHPTQCVPCAFWTKRLCSKGAACTFCHIPHPGTIRPKPSKDARLRRRENLRANVSRAVEDEALKKRLPVMRSVAKE